jgi:N-methylhydantoinase A/oxoprolinase/acetone carboxylase beta subunit
MQMEGVLIVTILRGVKLADRELFGKQDPYVVLSLADSTGPSSVCVGPMSLSITIGLGLRMWL